MINGYRLGDNYILVEEVINRIVRRIDIDTIITNKTEYKVTDVGRKASVAVGDIVVLDGNPIDEVEVKNCKNLVYKNDQVIFIIY